MSQVALQWLVSSISSLGAMTPTNHSLVKHGGSWNWDHTITLLKQVYPVSTAAMTYLFSTSNWAAQKQALK